MEEQAEELETGRGAEAIDGLPPDGIEAMQRLRFDAVRRGGHVHVAVWAGTARADHYLDGSPAGWLGGQRAKAGDLVLRPEEWEALREILEVGFSALDEAHAAMGGRDGEATDLLIDYREED